ncbi:hypothetical protein BH09CHL1_BH09CHL1_31780 [soil metagenome]
MTNLIPFPSPRELESDGELSTFFGSSIVRDNTPLINPGFAARLAVEVASAAQRRHRTKRTFFFRPGLASAALVALILGGMFAMMGSPGQNHAIAPAPLIDSTCDAPYRTPTDIENLAFIATIDEVESVPIGSMPLFNDGTPIASSSKTFAASFEPCALTGLHPMMLLSFSDEYVLYVFDRAFQSGVSAPEIQDWARSIAEPLTTEERTDLVSSLTTPGIDEFIEATQWTSYDAATIKPTLEPRCYAGVRSADDMVAIVQKQAVFEQLGGPSDVSLFTIEGSIEHLMRFGGVDFNAELSACIRDGLHPLATTYFDGFYVRELFLRYAATGASYTKVVELAESIALPQNHSKQIAYLRALIGVRFELTTGATMEIQSFPAAANEDGFIPAIGIGTADRNDPLTPPAQQWRVVDDVILAPADETYRRWELPFGDANFVVPPWMALPSQS